MELLEGHLRIDDLETFLETIGTVADDHDATIQAFDADAIAGRRHLERAVELADRAIERGENVARERAVEILLYAAGRRQIDRALELGVDEGEGEVVILLDGGDEVGARETLEARLDRLDLEPAPVLEQLAEPRLVRQFEITDAEREATDADLEALVSERVALLDVEK